MIELALISILAVGADSSNLALISPTIITAVLGAILCASAGGAVFAALSGTSSRQGTDAQLSRSSGIVVVASIGLLVALFARGPLYSLALRDSVLLRASATTVSHVASLFGLATAYGAIVALCLVLPGIASSFVSSTFAPRSRLEAVLLKSGTMLCATVLVFLFWGHLCDGFIELIGVR